MSRCSAFKGVDTGVIAQKGAHFTLAGTTTQVCYQGPTILQIDLELVSSLIMVWFDHLGAV